MCNRQCRGSYEKKGGLGGWGTHHCIQGIKSTKSRREALTISPLLRWVSNPGPQSPDPEPHPARCTHNHKHGFPTHTSAATDSNSHPRSHTFLYPHAHLRLTRRLTTPHCPHSGMRTHTHTNTHTRAHAVAHTHTLWLCFCVLSELMRKVPVPCG